MPLIIFAILLRTFLHTGLFILAHDAMHLSLVPGRPDLNHQLGRLALFLYAFLPYSHCLRKHKQHHDHSGHGSDPDYHDGSHHHPLLWYCRFMRQYVSPGQLGLMGLGGGVATLVLYVWAQSSPLHLLVFWLLPLVLSSIQLFYFGTYLPHREAAAPFYDHHRARSLHLPPIWSLLSCYHFSYHWEHHEYPQIPWYQLPQVYLSKVARIKVDQKAQQGS
ncbi:MAG: beta-carotene ketolase [Synechococcaceae cyanobacterium SM2_3_1]|nr:beta-carotene ketolase [Synechococcaceae cyanobacterium SM2_3_1]